MNFEKHVTSKEALDILNDALKYTKDFTFPNDDITLRRLEDIEFNYPYKGCRFVDYSFIELIKKAYNLT